MFNQTSQLTMVSWEETMALESWHFVACVAEPTLFLARHMFIQSHLEKKYTVYYCLMM
jgi:hypothetical protein